MAGFAERFREEGMQQSERVVLERQLQRRFGPLKPELLKKPEQASTSELEQLAAKHYL